MINLNTATVAELDAVAQLRGGHGSDIVHYREEPRWFDEVPQLEQVLELAVKWDGAQTQVGIA